MVGKRGAYLFKKSKKIDFFTFAIILIVWCACVKCENGKILEIAQQCEQRCPDQNRTNSDHMDVGCGKDCYIKQCTLGCNLWKEALNTSCQFVCSKTEKELLEPKELYCVIGCNDALNRYFKWLKAEIKTPHAPALLADSLNATSLSLEWEVPLRIIELAQGNLPIPKSYLVQWRFEEIVGDWKYCRNQSMGENSTVRVNNLKPYTKYRFRVVLLLSPNHDEVLISEQSVVISTLAMGVPESKPQIVRAVAVDHNKITISWEPGPFPNGPILSYVLQINNTQDTQFSAIKDIPAADKTRFYMFEKLTPSNNYSISVKMRNPEGEGPDDFVIVSTHDKPEQSDIQTQPILILATEYSIISQSSDILSEPFTRTIYTSKHKIVGVAIYVLKKLMFVTDSSRSIFKIPLEEEKDQKAINIMPKGRQNFKPTLLSLDWLNEHLYILGEVEADSQRYYQIARCDLDGNGFVVAIAGLQRRPSCIEVDSFNGYLFWTVSGKSSVSGLFSLDLADISNGVKHEDRPSHMIVGKNVGAFVVAHKSYRLLVPFQDNNTIISMTIKGQNSENIRHNTQSPKFHSVKSLAVANDLFYWTNGHEVLTEEYHATQKSYYHNAYPDSANRTFVSVNVNLSSSQPIPIPLNPPSKVQALMSTHRAKISWQGPHLLENQGRGAWQAWNYSLEIVSGDNITQTIKSIKGTTYTVDDLEANTEYTIRVAAYTAAGTGQWSTEFKSKTLKATDKRLLLWSSMDGLFQSDIIGEHFQTLINKTQLDKGYISDVTWFENNLYVVSNSTLKIYNHNFTATKGVSAITLIGKIDSVESVAVDWIGKRLYWSNPTQQLITRSYLNGEQQEPLPILTLAKEIKIDALQGWIYYSTGHAVEACRLNGKDKHSYVQLQLYSGKQIMGLTLDIENRKLFWIVRSYEQSTLYSASLADANQKNSVYFEKQLKDSNLEGPLTHFSDRLLWLQNNETVIIGDMEAKYLAKIRTNELSALKSISIIDPSHHVYPSNISNRVNVIPEPVNNASIKINARGKWNNFSITWLPIRNVNYGQIFYDLRIHVKRGNGKDIVKEMLETTFCFPLRLAPYSALEITIRAFTYWGSSSLARTELTSPVNYPAAPNTPRVFLSQKYELLLGRLDIEAILRWNAPLKPNGPIEGYRITYGYEKDDLNNITVAGDVHEYVIKNLVHNVTYQFKIVAFTKIGDGSPTAIISVTTNQEQPIPKILAANDEQISIIDLDLPKTIPFLSTGNPVKYMTPLQLEKRLFWVNANNEIMSHVGATKTKLLSVGAPVLSLNIDWIMRVLYWSQETSEGYAIFSLDLNRYEKYKHEPVKFYKSMYKITNLIVSPMDMRIFWIETAETDVGETSLIIYKHLPSDIKEFAYQFLDPSIPCYTSNMTTVRQTLALDTSMDTGPSLVWADNTNTFYSTRISDKECYPIGLKYNESMFNSVRDGDRTYWIDVENDLILAQNTNDKVVYSYNASGYRQLLSFYHQNYPERKCLLPLQQQQKYRVILNERSADSLVVDLPKPQMHSNCSLKPASVKYTIYLKTYVESDTESCDKTKCTTIETYDHIKTITGLNSFTKYRIQVGLSNYYSEKLHQTMKLGPLDVYSTSPGQPSQPRNVHAEAISPNEVVVNWSPPEHFNSDRIRYEVHWQTEDIISNLKNKQQQLVSDFEPIEKNHLKKPLSISLDKLLPNHSYTVSVRAYTSDSTYSESDTIKVETFPAPNNITKTEETPHSMIIEWHPDEHISQYIVQYAMAGSPIWKTVFNSERKAQQSGNYSDGKYSIRDLQPKTQYRFVILLYYAKRVQPYIWPSDSRFEFETLGDHPTAPGKPVIKLLKENTYQVLWEPAKENGAQIDEYNLEVRKQQQPSVVRAMQRRSAPSNIIEMKDEDYPKMDNGTDLDDYHNDITDHEWHIYYNGTDPYTVIQKLSPINEYAFKVRARNSYGWGPYSSESTHIQESLVAPHPGPSKIVYGSIFSVSVVVAVLLIIATGLCCLSWRKKKMDEKILYPDTATAHLPDFELANLRELPRRGINSNNILYSSGPLTDSEIALLPQIKRDQLSMTDFLGSGAFGEVYEGVVNCVGEEPETRVAIKTLRKGATEQEKGEFLQEAQLMSNFKHEHILKLIGICLEHDSLYIIMELMQGGDLLSFLRQSRPIIETPSSLSLLDLISMCVDVAAGCRYLEEMHFVHRDLACRNCLVSSVDPTTRVVKIGDFGLARDIYKNDYYRKEGEGLLPVRWMSPESLVYGVFTSQSDIWAFGVLCWEIMTLGQQPYPARNNVEVLHYVRNGGRLEQPADCPEELHKLMLLCWSYSPDDRPTFRYCLEVLKLLQLRTCDSIQITSQFPCKTAAVSNKSYFLQDINHNTQGYEGTFKYPLVNSNGSIIQTPPPSASTTGTNNTTIPPPPSQLSTIPKYLELVYDENIDNNNAGHQQLIQQPPPPINDYEKPITDLFLNNNNNNNNNNNRNSFNNSKERTFSSSSTVSNISSSTPLPPATIVTNFSSPSNRNSLKNDSCLRRDMEALLSSSFLTTTIADINKENSAGSAT